MSEEAQTANTGSTESTPQTAAGDPQATTGSKVTIQELPEVEPATGEPQDPQNQPAEEYKLDLDPNLAVDESFGKYLTAQAKENGLPAKEASKYINSAIAEVLNREKAAMHQDLLDLRKEWGADYGKRAKATYEFTTKVCDSLSISEQDARFLSSPAGYRLMYKLSKAFSEQSAVGANSASPSLNAEQRRAMANDMRSNPQNPYYKALNMPSVPDSERRIAFKKFNELYGRQVYPE